MSNFLHKWFFSIIGVLILTLAYFGANSLWAAPQGSGLHQTVPFPTFTPENTPVPTATPEEVETAPDGATDDESAEGTGEEAGNGEAESPDVTPTPTETPDARFNQDIESEGTAEDELGEEEVFSEGQNDGPNEEGGSNQSSEDGSSETQNASEGESTGENSSSGSSSETPLDLPEYTAEVKPIVLNVRSGAGTESPVIGTLFQADQVTVLGRNGNWWLACCPLGLSEPGWVDSQFLEPNFNVAQIERLIPARDDAGNPLSTSVVQNDVGISTQALNDSHLLFQISHEPRYVWPGQQLEMTFTITNTSTEMATQLRLRDDFPVQLSVIDSTVIADGQVEFSTSSSGSSVLVVRWPELDPGGSLTMQVTLLVDEDVPAGSVIDNLAIAEASNASGVTAGITIGMPPVTLPGFQ